MHEISYSCDPCKPRMNADGRRCSRTLTGRTGRGRLSAFIRVHLRIMSETTKTVRTRNIGNIFITPVAGSAWGDEKICEHPHGLAIRKDSCFDQRNPASDALSGLLSPEDGYPFAAAWKAPEITIGDILPENLGLDENLSYDVVSKYDGEKVGSFQVYYTQAILAEKIRKAKEGAARESEAFHIASRSRLNGVIASQGVGIFIVLLCLAFCLIFFLRMLILNPVNMLSNTAHQLAQFDLTVSLATNRKDEIGTLLRAVNTMIEEFRRIVSDVKSGGKQLAGASVQMTEHISAIASATEEISVSAQHVSETAGQMSQNNSTVAGAVEEISVSINEAERNARRGSSIAVSAVRLAGKAGDTMRSLGEAANRIGQVTGLIKKIADKMTLLALNAHIEAASAGDAGKGFAVVANEIKEFARQSTSAAEDISNRISAMQESTLAAIDVIREVSGIIDSISHSSQTISLALEDQMKAVSEISANAEDANIRAENIAVTMEELAESVNEVSMRVGMAAGRKGGEIRDDIHYMNASAAEVAKLANALLGLVEKFKIEGRAARGERR